MEWSDMDEINKNKECSLAGEQLKNLRAKVRERLIREELECVMRFEAVDRLMMDLNVDPESFRRLWVRPLLAEGVSLEVALVGIAKSHFQPN